MDKNRTFPPDLDIDLSEGADDERFKWLLACMLFSVPISQEIAAKTYRVLESHGFASPDKLARAKHEELVRVLGEGGYRRYDESTARKLVGLGIFLQEKYGGSLNKLHEASSSSADLEKRIQEIKGIGPVGTGIYMREAG